jgi:hypothetical protein
MTQTPRPDIEKTYSLDTETVNELIINAVMNAQNKFAPRHFNGDKMQQKLYNDDLSYEQQKSIEDNIQQFRFFHYPKIQNADRVNFFKENRKNFPDLEIHACEYLAAAQTYVMNEERLKILENLSYNELNDHLKKSM